MKPDIRVLLTGNWLIVAYIKNPKPHDNNQQFMQRLSTEERPKLTNVIADKDIQMSRLSPTLTVAIYELILEHLICQRFS